MIVAYMPDLIMRSKLDVASRHYQVNTLVVSDMKSFEAGLAQSPHTVLIDLDADESLTMDMLKASLKTPARVMVFCSHVLTDLIQEARDNGAKLIYTNSTITAALPGLVSEVAHALNHHTN